MPYLDGTPVNPDEIDPAKHKFIGLFRPPAAPTTRHIDDSGKVIYADAFMCGCGQTLWTIQDIYDHYQRGHFDEPQYITIKKEQP